MTSYAQAAAATLAVCVALWPQIKEVVAWLAARQPSLPTIVKPSAVHPTYAEAMADLQNVRLRLIKTECFADDQRSAIDVLTLALVDGSDK
jgi:hypothetical protein